MECPICKKSIKYDKNLIPDEKSRDSYISSQWETHFLTDCSHESPATGGSVPRPHCGAVGCRTILGPSNSFNCPKCHVTVCLAHRVPEDHKCAETTRSRRLNHLATTSTGSQGHNHTSVSIKKTTTQPSTKKKASTSTKDQFANTLKGSAERRKQKESTVSNVSGDRISAQPLPPPPPSSTTTVASASETSLISCPFCAFNSINSVEMEEHVNVFHLQLFETAASSQSSGPLPIPYLAEECPQCKQRFPDAVALVSHVELHHREPVTTGGRDCSLS
eukprot:gene22038-30270_t